MPERVTLPNGRIVTPTTEWWYKHQKATYLEVLYCIHNKSLLQGCNECVDAQEREKDK